MSSVQIKDKTENTAPAGDEWLFAEDPATPYTVQKMSVNTIGDYITDYAGFTPEVVGASIKTYATLIPISQTFPWLCLSYPSVDLTTTNYSTEFIDALRARKYIYDEFNDPLLSPKAESFSGSWSSNVFTLDDTTANNTMLAELAEDWLYHGSPTANWRIINDGTLDFKMITMDVTARTITVDLDSETATGTSIIIYTNRVYRQATQARHFSEAGLATYQAGGGKSGRLFRRDQMQLLTGSFDTNRNAQSGDQVGGAIGAHSISSTGGSPLHTTGYAAAVAPSSRVSFNSSTSPDARTSATTDGETIAKSSSRYEYIYVGSYTA